MMVLINGAWERIAEGSVGFCCVTVRGIEGVRGRGVEG